MKLISFILVGFFSEKFIFLFILKIKKKERVQSDPVGKNQSRIK